VAFNLTWNGTKWPYYVLMCR